MAIDLDIEETVTVELNGAEFVFAIPTRKELFVREEGKDDFSVMMESLREVRGVSKGGRELSADEVREVQLNVKLLRELQKKWIAALFPSEAGAKNA